MGAPVQQPGRDMYMPMNNYMQAGGWMPADPNAYHQQMGAPMMSQYGYQMAPQMAQMPTSGSYMNGGTAASYTMSMAPYMPAAMKPPQPGQQGPQGQRGDLRDMINMYLPENDPARMLSGAPPAAHVQAVYQQGTPPTSSEGNSVPLTHM